MPAYTSDIHFACTNAIRLRNFPVRHIRQDPQKYKLQPSCSQHGIAANRKHDRTRELAKPTHETQQHEAQALRRNATERFALRLAVRRAHFGPPSRQECGTEGDWKCELSKFGQIVAFT